MKTSTVVLIALGALSLGASGHVYGQGMPTTQPKMLQIFREHVKVGHAAAHSKFEAAFPAAFEKAKSPYYYLAMTSLTGPSEAWYVTPYSSFSAIGDSMKRSDKDPALSAELDRLGLADAEHITAAEGIVAMARPDLSLGDFPDIAKMRFVEISIFRVRIGHDEQFGEVAKAYAAAAKRANPKASYRTYEVLSGMPGGTLLIFSSVEDYSEFDQRMRDSEATFKGVTEAESAALKKFGECMESTESIYFRIDPVQSYVAKDIRDKAPDFWMPK